MIGGSAPAPAGAQTRERAAEAVPAGTAPRGGRDQAGEPRFDQQVPRGGYLWWYIDALSDDGANGLTIIVFVGSVFSPYYALGRACGRDDPEDYCAVNVCLYGRSARRWTMTERGRTRLWRSAREMVIGPSRIAWDGSALVVDVDEIGVPIPRRVHGRVRVVPQGLSRFVTELDADGRHRWGPIAPVARIEVEFERPDVRWGGHAYVDSNEGDEPIDRAFREWDWSRTRLADGSTAVIYDVRPASGPDRVIAERFSPDGSPQAFEPPPRQPLPVTLWRIPRTMRSDPGIAPRVVDTLEDTPFYTRSTVESGLLGERVLSMHETIDLPRVVSWPVRFMLPWRMPRRA